jgi:hypothetical protein
VNHHVALFGQRIQGFPGAGRAIAELGGVYHFLSAVILHEDLLQLLEEGICVVLPVFQKTDHFALEAGKVGIKTYLLGHVFSARVQDLDGRIPGCYGGYLLRKWGGSDRTRIFI